MSKLRHVRIELGEANAFVEQLHRHHKPVVGHLFSIGAEQDGKIVGVAIVGRPVSRHRDDGTCAEVTRLCTDGTKNACSFLYGACARAAFAIGYRKIGTYILASEPGTSLVGGRMASDWRAAAVVGPCHRAHGLISFRHRGSCYLSASVPLDIPQIVWQMRIQAAPSSCALLASAAIFPIIIGFQANASRRQAKGSTP